MDILYDIATNKAITIPLIAWFIAQTIKFITIVLKENKIKFSRFIGSGGMPSSHSAYMISLATIMGLNEGWGSPYFAITLAVSLIVMYDAANVRRETGNQAKVLNMLLFSNEFKGDFDKNLKELLGHTPIEVVAGAFLGIVVGVLMNNIY